MATLYELNDEYTRLLAQLEVAETEEEMDCIWMEIDEVESDAARKAASYAYILRNKLAEAEALKAEKQRLEAKQKAAEGVVGRIKNLIYSTMYIANTNEIATPIGKWKRQLNNPSVQVLDEAAVPAEFRVPQPDKIDKVAILKHFKATGELVDGIDVVRTEGVRFR